jgi:hypothetical protein
VSLHLHQPDQQTLCGPATPLRGHQPMPWILGRGLTFETRWFDAAPAFDSKVSGSNIPRLRAAPSEADLRPDRAGGTPTAFHRTAVPQ